MGFFSDVGDAFKEGTKMYRDPAGLVDFVTGADREAEANRQAVERANQQNISLQREFAQHGIRWRVEDAIAAGIHPLAALGAAPSGFSPSVQAFTDDRRARTKDFALNMGQNLLRAQAATMTPEQKTAAALELESMSLDNQLKAHHLNELKSGRPFPSVVEKPLERVAAEVDNPWQEVGNYPSVAYMKSPTGLVPVMPPNLAEALESDQTNQAQWAIRYKGGPNFAPAERPSKNKLPAWASGWVWSFKLQEWQPVSRHTAESMGRRAMERKHEPRTSHRKYRFELQDFMR